MSGTDEQWLIADSLVASTYSITFLTSIYCIHKERKARRYFYFNSQMAVFLFLLFSSVVKIAFSVIQIEKHTSLSWTHRALFLASVACCASALVSIIHIWTELSSALENAENPVAFAVSSSRTRRSYFISLALVNASAVGLFLDARLRDLSDSRFYDISTVLYRAILFGIIAIAFALAGRQLLNRMRGMPLINRVKERKTKKVVLLSTLCTTVFLLEAMSNTLKNLFWNSYVEIAERVWIYMGQEILQACTIFALLLIIRDSPASSSASSSSFSSYGDAYLSGSASGQRESLLGHSSHTQNQNSVYGGYFSDNKSANGFASSSWNSRSISPGFVAASNQQSQSFRSVTSSPFLFGSGANSNNPSPRQPMMGAGPRR